MMNNNTRILAIDYGQKRIGLALSDVLHITAQPYQTLQHSAKKTLIQQIVEIVKKENVAEIIVGLPKRLDGSMGDMAHEAKAFGKQLRQHLDIRIKFWDERFSTHAAEKALLEGDVRRSKRKKVIDQTAAAWMLQGYLDSKPK